MTRVPLAQILGELLAAFLLMRVLPAVGFSARGFFRPAVILTLYRRAWPLVLNALLGLVIFNSDSFFLRIYRDSATLGYYAAAYALVSFMLNVGRSYQMTLMPAVSRSMDNPESERVLYHSATAQVFAGVFPVALGGSLVAPRLIPWVFGPAYPSVLPLQILLWALPVALFRNVSQGVMIAHGRQDQMLRTSTLAAISNIGTEPRTDSDVRDGGRGDHHRGHRGAPHHPDALAALQRGVADDAAAALLAHPARRPDHGDGGPALSPPGGLDERGGRRDGVCHDSLSGRRD